MERGRVRIAVACAVAHTLLLACYTLPAHWVPLRLRFWSQAYARVLFHQDWRLFAPDPPACGCTVEMAIHGNEWRPLSDAHPHFVWTRMCANACRFAEACHHADDPTIEAPEALSRSLERMAATVPHTGPLVLRVHQRCPEERLLPIVLRSP